MREVPADGVLVRAARREDTSAFAGPLAAPVPAVDPSATLREELLVAVPDRVDPNGLIGAARGRNGARRRG